MKKLIALSLAIFFVVMLCSCSATGNEYYKYGKRAVEIIDKYLDYEIGAEEAYLELSVLVQREETLPETESSRNNIIKADVSLARYDMKDLMEDPSVDALAELKEHRNSIKQYMLDRE